MMLKVIIVVDIPECCEECDYIRKDLHSACCTVYYEQPIDEERLYKEIPISIVCNGKPNGCPIKPIPERYEKSFWFTEYWDGRSDGWNACLDTILKED